MKTIVSLLLLLIPMMSHASTIAGAHGRATEASAQLEIGPGVRNTECWVISTPGPAYGTEECVSTYGDGYTYYECAWQDPTSPYGADWCTSHYGDFSVGTTLREMFEAAEVTAANSLAQSLVFWSQCVTSGGFWDYYGFLCWVTWGPSSDALSTYSCSYRYGGVAGDDDRLVCGYTGTWR